MSKALLAAILVSAAFMMGYAAYYESATFDESAHIPAGYANVRYLDYRLNPEHPPLAKAIAAAPLLFLRLDFPTHLDAWQKDVNGQWVMGGNFFYESGNDGQLIVRTARIGPILLTLLLAFLIYAWAARLIGSAWALLPTFLFAWSPNVLAHGHYVTTDIAAAFGIALATLAFIQFLFAPTRKHLLYAGLAFGAAQLLKFSAVLLLPYFVFLIAVFYGASVLRDWDETITGARVKRFATRAWRHIQSVLFMWIIGYALVVYPAYFLFTAQYPPERQARDTEVILQSFKGGRTPEGQACAPMRCLADLAIKAARFRPTQPLAEYALGVLTAFQRSQGGNANYFLGKVSGSGSPIYFPVVYALKEPLPILLALFVAAAVAIGRTRRAWRHTSLRVSLRARLRQIASSERAFTVFAMAVFIAIYWFTSIASPLNIGLRHLFPTLPFLYILIAWGWKEWTMDNGARMISERAGVKAFFENTFARIKTLARAIFKTAFLAALLLWLTVETLVVAPHFLSYFNELGGGTDNGYRYTTDSNYDWGQDLLYLREFTEARGIEKIAVDYFGGGSPRFTLGARAENWWSARGNPQDAGIRWLAVSVNTLQGAVQPAKGFYERKQEDEYRWLMELRPRASGLGRLPGPDYRAGTSIFIYKL